MNGRNVIDTSPTPSPPGRRAAGKEVAQRLIQHAARHAPPLLAERLEEEWLADLTARHGPTSRLLFALGCCWATQTIARDHSALVASAARAATGSTTMTAHAHSSLTLIPRHTTVLVSIVGIHVAIIYAFATGLANRLIQPPQPPIKVDFLRDAPVKEIPPPLPKVELERTTVELRRDPDLTPVVDPGDTIHDLPPAPPAATLSTQAPRPPAPVKRVAGGPGKGFPDSDDYYPPAARRLNEQGSAAVQVCVDPTGRLTAEPTITQSSGHSRLDEGAIKLAKAGSGHYRPTTENGVPVSSCYAYLIRFHLQ